MTIKKALIANAQPYMMAARVQMIFQEEASKGCRSEIYCNPVALEPVYCRLLNVSDIIAKKEQEEFTPEPPPNSGDLVRLQIWLSPDEKFNWLSSELFIKHLRSVSHRVGFEIIGNNENIQIRFIVHQFDLPIIFSSFRGQFERCEITNITEDPLLKAIRNSALDVRFFDYLPPPPYSHLFTRPEELKISTYQSLIASLINIKPPSLGFYQALFQPVKTDHNWHRNIQVLLDLEFAFKLNTDLQLSQRYNQQAPSGDLKQMALEVETKAHNDKPIFAVALRLGIIAPEESGSLYLKSMDTFLNLFQHGGRSLKHLTEKNYCTILSRNEIEDMFLLGLTYRPGFLVNSAEITGTVHIPPATILEHRSPPISLLETLPVQNPELSKGTPIGNSEYAGMKTPVCIPLGLRSRSTHIIGRPGTAKSTIMARMVLDDIDKGMGVAVLDPHGDLVNNLLCLIGKKHIEKTIYFDPGHPDYVPLWNPLHRCHGQSISRTADDLVAAIKNVVSGWGDRMEHLLRNGFFALLQLPGSTLLDLSNLLRRKTTESDNLRKEILEVVDNVTAHRFWKHDFERYSNEALDPPKHKLSKLLVSETVALMLSQPENRIDFRKIMDDGKIILINLSTVGLEAREILGCFILSLLHLTALGRAAVSVENRRQFHIHVDEAHRFVTDALEDLIAETRKFGVSLSLAHHYLSQFGNKKIDALSSVGTTIIMNVDGRDARYLSKDLRNLVKYEDMINLKIDEAIVRIGNDIVRLKKNGPLQFPKTDYADAIIRQSFEKYYKPVHEIRQKLRTGRNNLSTPLPAVSKGQKIEELKYDEF
jgi:hypothetical protein